MRQTHFDVSVKSLNDTNNIDCDIVIDNTLYPSQGGATPTQQITLLLQTRTDFENKVTVKNILILEGMVCSVLLFGCGMFLYLCCKMRAGHREIALQLLNGGKKRRESLRKSE